MALFEFMTGGVLLAPVNITNLVLQNSYIVIMALGMLLIIVGGNIDLSVGSIVGFVGAIAATMMVDYKMPWVPVVGLSLVLGGLIGAAQGYFVAFAKIPSFIVTLGGMLIFRGLTGNILLGQFVGPFPRDFQSISSGFIPDFVSAPLFAIFGNGFFGANFRWTSMLIGLIGAALLIFTSARRWRREKAHTMETEPFALFVGKNAIFAILIVGLCYLLASYRGLPNVLITMGALILLYMFVTHRMTIGRRIYALGGNRMAAQLSGIRTERLIFLDLRQHGRAGRPRRADRRGAAELGDAERRQFLRTRRHRRLLHRRRLGLRRRRQGDGRRDRRLRDGRHEQRHVDPRHRDLLAIRRQGPGAAGGGLCRRLPEEQGIENSAHPDRSGGRAACDLLDADHDEFRRLDRGEADENVDHAPGDVGLRGGAGVAFDEVSLVCGVALKCALGEQALHEGLDVTPQPLP